MIGISIAAQKEWETALSYFSKDSSDCIQFPYGEYFKINLKGQEVLFYYCGSRKVQASASAQYMIDHFILDKLIVAGTCAGIDDTYSVLDIFIPSKAVQYDCTVKETEPLIKERFSVYFDLSKYDFPFNTGTIGTADRAVVMWKDYMELKNNHITIADTESGAIAYVCKMNQVECIILKGISDFPENETNQDALKSNEDQMNVYLNNTPIVMRKIFDEYLLKFI